MTRPHDQHCEICDMAEFSGITYEAAHGQSMPTASQLMWSLRRIAGFPPIHNGMFARIDSRDEQPKSPDAVDRMSRAERKASDR